MAAAGRWTELSRLESPGTPILLEPDAAGALGMTKGTPQLPAGGRRLFRAALRSEASFVQVVAAGACVGRLHAADAARYAMVLDALARGLRTGVCSGYLLAQGGGAFEARLLLHDPEECLRRIELDGAAGVALDAVHS